jgi:parallel beta-helix repeat protein
MLAIYADNGGVPGTRLGVTAETTINSSEGWQTISLTSPVSVSADQVIWLAWVTESGAWTRAEVGTPGRASSGQGWSGGMPSDFGSASFSDYIYSIYATYTTGPCTPDCTGLECGPDPNCGTECGPCTGEQICNGGTCEDPPASGCTVISGGGSWSGSTTGESNDLEAHCNANSASNIGDACYEWTATVTGEHRFDTCSSSTNFDTMLYLYNADGSSEITCNDDDDVNCSNYRSGFSWSVTVGTTYRIYVDGYEDEGDFVLNIEAPGGCTPDCSGKNCGDDGCGGSCGTCSGGQTCVSGVCTGCTPDCTGKNCGDDGCGGSCGTCSGGQICNIGTCEDPGSGYHLDNTHPSASDSNPGTEAEPWETLPGAVSQLSAGDLLYVHEGNDYNAPSRANFGGSSESNRIVIRNYPGDRPVVDEASGGQWEFTNSQYVTISGFELSSTPLLIKDSDYVIVENNLVHHARFAITLDNSNYCVVRHNEVYGSKTQERIGEVGIKLSNSSHNNLVQYNHTYNTFYDYEQGDGILIAYGSHHNVISYNRMHDNPDDNLDGFESGGYNIVEYNIGYRAGYDENGTILLNTTSVIVRVTMKMVSSAPATAKASKPTTSPIIGSFATTSHTKTSRRACRTRMVVETTFSTTTLLLTTALTGSLTRWPAQSTPTMRHAATRTTKSATA